MVYIQSCLCPSCRLGRGCFESFVLSDESAGAKEDDEEDTVLRGDDAENVNNPVTIYSLRRTLSGQKH